MLVEIRILRCVKVFVEQIVEPFRSRPRALFQNDYVFVPLISSKPREKLPCRLEENWDPQLTTIFQKAVSKLSSPCCSKIELRTSFQFVEKALCFETWHRLKNQQSK